MKSKQGFEGVDWPVAVSPTIERDVEEKQALPAGLQSRSSCGCRRVALSPLLSAHTDSVPSLWPGKLCPDKSSGSDAGLWCQAQIGFLCGSVGDWKTSVQTMASAYRVAQKSS